MFLSPRACLPIFSRRALFHGRSPYDLLAATLLNWIFPPFRFTFYCSRCTPLTACVSGRVDPPTDLRPTTAVSPCSRLFSRWDGFLRLARVDFFPRLAHRPVLPPCVKVSRRSFVSSILTMSRFISGVYRSSAIPSFSRFNPLMPSCSRYQFAYREYFYTVGSRVGYLACFPSDTLSSNARVQSSRDLPTPRCSSPPSSTLRSPSYLHRARYTERSLLLEVLHPSATSVLVPAIPVPLLGNFLLRM